VKRIALFAAIVVALVALSGGIAIASGMRDDNSKPITGEVLARASAAALALTGRGKVTETEVGDEDAYYEVEVTLDSGRQVDVHLDRSFELVSTEGDTEVPGSRDDANDS
jgi:hypothetical protein